MPVKWWLKVTSCIVFKWELIRLKCCLKVEHTNLKRPTFLGSISNSVANPNQILEIIVLR